jgi:hypothetical protein
MKKIGENDVAIFYSNMFTQDYGDGYKIIVGELKSNGEKEYLLLKNDKIIYANQSIESIYYYHDFITSINQLSVK